MAYGCLIPLCTTISTVNLVLDSDIKSCPIFSKKNPVHSVVLAVAFGCSPWRGENSFQNCKVWSSLMRSEHVVGLNIPMFSLRHLIQY